MNAEQIVAYAERQGFRVVVTEGMVIDAIGKIASPFTCRDVTEAIPRDAQGSTVSEYLVALWLDDLHRRKRVRTTDRWLLTIGKPALHLYEVVP